MRSPTSLGRRKQISRDDADDSSVSIIGADSLIRGGYNEDDAANDRITEELKEAATTNDDDCPSDEETAAERRNARSGWASSAVASPASSTRNNTVEYGTADVDNVSILKEDYLSDEAVKELATDNFAALLERAAYEDGREKLGQTRFYEQAEHSRGMGKNPYDDDDATVKHGNTKQRLCDMRLGLCASICLALSAILAFFGSDLFDEDDAITIATVAKAGGQAGGSAATAAQ
jgi:hypothetical protein